MPEKDIAQNSGKDQERATPQRRPPEPGAGIPRENLSDDPGVGADSAHQEDVAGRERRTGVPHETPRDDREARTGFPTGND